MLRALFALMLLITAAQAEPTIPPATIDNHLEVTGDTVRARVVETRLSVPVRIDGQGPFRFIVDSGADRSVVGAALAQRLGLPHEGTALLQGMAGPSVVETVRVDALLVGRNIVPGILAPALAETDLGADGILGIDALALQRVRLDFEAKAITVEDARRPEPTLRADADAIVVTARRRKGQLILTEIDVGRGQIYAVIDSGAQVTVGNAALRARVFAGRTPPPVTKVTLTSVTGKTIEADLIVFPLIRLGGLQLRGVAVAFVDAPPFRLFGLDRDPAMLIGTDVLAAFARVSLDFRHRKVRFVLRH